MRGQMPQSELAQNRKPFHDQSLSLHVNMVILMQSRVLVNKDE